MRRTIGLSIMFASLITSFSATAQTSELEASVVFFELYLRDAPNSKTPAYVTKIETDIQQYNQYSVLPRSDAQARIQESMVMPPARVNNERLQAIEEMVEQGNELVYTNPREAIEVLHRAKHQLKEIVDNISLDSASRRAYYTTQMLLVRSHLDNGNPNKAREIMVEIVRTFEDEYPVTEENYHPRVVELYREVFAELTDQRNATLTIRTTPTGCDVFINGRARREKTPYTFEGLYPGSIRINVRKGDMQSMIRKVDVSSNGSATVEIDLEYEASLSFSEGRFGLTFSNAAAMEANMIAYTTRLGELLEVDQVVLSGVVPAAEGHTLNTYQIGVQSAQIVRQQKYPVRSNVVSNRRVQEAAAFLADVQLNVEQGIIYKPWYTNWIGWTTAGAAVAMGGVSVAFLVKFLGHKDNAQNSNFGDRDLRVDQANQGNDAQTLAGIFGGLAGAAAIASGLVFAFVDMEDESASATRAQFEPTSPQFHTSPMLIPNGGGWSAEWRF